MELLLHELKGPAMAVFHTFAAARFHHRVKDRERKTLHKYDALADNPELLQKLSRWERMS